MANAADFYGDVHFHKNVLIEAKLQPSATPPLSPQESQVYYNTVSKKFFGYDGTTWVDLSQAVAGSITIKGNITNADTNPAFPASPNNGDMWLITTTNGTVGGIAVKIGDELVFGDSGWFKIGSELQQATQALEGFARFATQAEANAGSSTTLSISPATLASFLINFLYARKFVATVNLVADTPLQVTHGLNLLDASDLVVEFFQGGNRVFLSITPDTINRIIVQASATLSNVKVVCLG